MNLSQSIADKTEAIVNAWILRVEGDREIPSSKSLTYTEIRDSLPMAMKALATFLAGSDRENRDDIETLSLKSLRHGLLRAEQGYDIEEIVREYSLLREIIFEQLEVELTMGSAAETLSAVRSINYCLDQMVAFCVERYTGVRMAELELLQQQMMRTNQELKRLVLAEQENFSLLAHELKTPLASIIGFSDTFLRQNELSDYPQDSLQNLHHIERVLDSGRLLLETINDALEISRCKAGKIRLFPEPLDLCAMVEQVVAMLRRGAGAQGLSFEVSCNISAGQVVLDPLRLRQVLTNLIGNAIRYTPVGQIGVVCEALDEHSFELLVTDSGVGIDAEEQSHVFEPYFQGAAGRRRSDSTGLGLAIVQQIVQQFGGEIELSSQPGCGSTFRLVLPFVLSEPAAPASPLRPELAES